MNKLLNEEQHVMATTDDFRQDGILSKHYTMISEFIDNSLSSWAEKTNQNHLPFTTINYKGCVVEINQIYTSSTASELIIVDNSNGMTIENLVEAMIKGNKRGNKSTTLNRYGLGMKIAAFWSGTSLEINTVRDKKSYKAEIDLDYLDKYKKGKIVYTPEISENKICFYSKDALLISPTINSGTKIIIKNIPLSKYNFKSTSEKAGQNTFADVIGDKFVRFIDQGATIILNVQYSNKMIKPRQISARHIRYENLNIWFKTLKKDTDQSVSYEKLKSKLINTLNLAHASSNKQKILKQKFIDKIQNDKDLLFHEEINFGNFTLPIKIGILANNKKTKNSDINKTYKTYNGMYVYESNRAIMCGPNDDRDAHATSLYKEGIRSEYGGTGVSYRINGSFEIDGLLDQKLINLSNNKVGFEWKNPDMNYKYIEFIEGWINSATELIKALTTIQEIAVPTFKKQENTEIKNTEIVAGTQDMQDFKPNPSENDKERLNGILNKWHYDIDNGNRQLTIVQKGGDLNTTDFYKVVKREGNLIEININVNHKLWRPIIQNAGSIYDKFAISLHKLVYVFVMLEKELNNESISDTINNIANEAFKNYG